MDWASLSVLSVVLGLQKDSGISTEILNQNCQK